MGLSLPVVGYVPATREGSDPDGAWNSKKFSTVDIFVGAIRNSFFEGWSDNLYPCGLSATVGLGLPIDPKNLQHRVFYEEDLTNRPELLELFKFIFSHPKGGFICVRDEQDIQRLFSSPGGDRLTPELCGALHHLSQIPVVVCGKEDDPRSLCGKLLRSRGNSKVIRDISLSAVSWRDRNEKRKSIFDKDDRLCRFSNLLSIPPDERPYVDKLARDDILCEMCLRKFGYEG